MRARERPCARAGVSVDAHRRRLCQVKEEMPKEYETFLEVLTQFRSQRCVGARGRASCRGGHATARR